MSIISPQGKKITRQTNAEKNVLSVSKVVIELVNKHNIKHTFAFWSGIREKKSESGRAVLDPAHQ